jgi:hypothetical protein
LEKVVEKARKNFKEVPSKFFRNLSQALFLSLALETLMVRAESLWTPLKKRRKLKKIIYYEIFIKLSPLLIEILIIYIEISFFTTGNNVLIKGEGLP